MSAHLHKVLQEKEKAISELLNKLKEYDVCLDEAERTFKVKLRKKTQVTHICFLLQVATRVSAGCYYYQSICRLLLLPEYLQVAITTRVSAGCYYYQSICSILSLSDFRK